MSGTNAILKRNVLRARCTCRSEATTHTEELARASTAAIRKSTRRFLVLRNFLWPATYLVISNFFHNSTSSTVRRDTFRANYSLRIVPFHMPWGSLFWACHHTEEFAAFKTVWWIRFSHFRRRKKTDSSNERSTRRGTGLEIPSLSKISSTFCMAQCPTTHSGVSPLKP